MAELRTGGTHVLLVTPFLPNRERDRESLASLIEHVLDAGADGVIALGTTGEFFTMSAAERADAIDDVVELVRGRVAVTIGVGSDSTAEAVKLARHAQSAGADCVMVLPPFYFAKSAEAQLAHFAAIAEAVDIHVMIYDGADGIEVDAATIATLAQELDNVRYVKMALPAPQRIAALRRLAPQVTVFAGDDATLVPALRLGAAGSAIATGNFLPREVITIHTAANSGDWEKASEVFASNLLHGVAATANPKVQFIARIKEVLVAQGVIAHATVRPPLAQLGPHDKADLLASVRVAGIL
ncbi:MULTISPECIES: dihydrodipicolinate synthase family protein [unclassified Streptomyces]|uniref:dihydrodipicolinate synthase family protein n=1 Tax=unclassified Streptomyces TaxID=2593676 RepID=UPI0020354F10|nr:MULTISPECIES: dihydrodipicolinate synthase family protein [unclassified Streptomyces]